MLYISGKDTQFTILSELASSLNNTTLNQPLDYPIQRQQSVTTQPASSRKSSKSSVGKVPSIDEANGVIEVDGVIAREQEPPDAMELEEDSPIDSEDEQEVDDAVTCNKGHCKFGESARGGTSYDNAEGPGPGGDSQRQYRQIERQISSEGSQRTDYDFIYRHTSAGGTFQGRLQRQYSSEGQPGRRKVPITDTNRAAFQDHLMMKPYHTRQRLQSDDSPTQDVPPQAMWRREIDVEEEPVAIRRRVRYGEKRHLRAFLPVWVELQKKLSDGGAVPEELKEDWEEGILFYEVRAKFVFHKLEKSLNPDIKLV